MPPGSSALCLRTCCPKTIRLLHLDGFDLSITYPLYFEASPGQIVLHAVSACQMTRPNGDKDGARLRHADL